jgi:hypothetical protein
MRKPCCVTQGMVTLEREQNCTQLYDSSVTNLVVLVALAKMIVVQ